MSIYLCIDAGTTRLKAALVDQTGDILALADRSAEVLLPFEGACEMDMEALWSQLCGVTQELKELFPAQWRDIEGVGVTGQGDGMWPVDAEGRPVGSAMLWNDTRTRDIGIERDAELSKFLVSKKSTALFAGAFPVLLKWLKQNAPSDYTRIAHVLHCKDWLNFRLTDVLASDYSDQSTASIDIFTKEYVLELFDRLDIPEMKAALPPLYPSTHVLGAVTAEAERISGIPAGVPVVTGCIDVAAVALGTGMDKLGDGCCILGTTLCCELLLCASQVNVHDTNGSALCSVLPDKYNRVMAALSGTATLDWTRRLLCPEMGFAELDEALKLVPPGSNGILFHPYLYGERAPFREPHACGGFYGLTAGHTRMELLRAAYEGQALVLMDCFMSLPKTDGAVYLSGGGAQSDFLCGLVASALHKTVLRPPYKELGIRGIAAVLRMALHEDAAVSGAQACRAFEPDEETHAVFSGLYETFVQLRKDMTPYWRAR